MITRRTLAPDEAQKAIDAGGPLHDLQLDATKLVDMSIAVVEDDGVIVAYWVVWYALHTEPIWVREDHRHSPAVIGGLIDQMETIVKATSAATAFCVIEEENVGVVDKYVERLGYLKAPGTLYYIVLPPSQPVED